MECKTDQNYSVQSPTISVEILGDLEENDVFKKNFDGEKHYNAVEDVKRNRMRSCCAPCIALSKYSWKTLGAMFLVLAVMLITVEMVADINFCYFTPVVPIDIIPMSTPRGMISFLFHHIFHLM